MPSQNRGRALANPKKGSTYAMPSQDGGRAWATLGTAMRAHMLQTQLDPYITGSGAGVPQRQGNPTWNLDGETGGHNMKHEV